MEERHAPTGLICLRSGKLFPFVQLSEIIEGHTMAKIQMAEIKKFCHLSRHPTARMNTSVARKSGYISIYLNICIYIEAFSRGCIYFFLSQPFNNLANFLFYPLALVIWKKDRYAATFWRMLVSTGLPKWLDKW